jgi:hypothetical protein
VGSRLGYVGKKQKDRPSRIGPDLRFQLVAGVPDRSAPFGF